MWKHLLPDVWNSYAEHELSEVQVPSHVSFLLTFVFSVALPHKALSDHVLAVFVEHLFGYSVYLNAAPTNNGEQTRAKILTAHNDFAMDAQVAALCRGD
jgi:hypothetical protein